VVLNEHFRCAPEIIEFSNREFYDSRLVPLRLPGKSERLSPSIVDVKVRNGVKVGKVNEKEADEIVRQVKDFVSDLSANTTPRSIGIISLVGDDQSRLIRGRLLDAVGPQLMARHDVLVGDPPSKSTKLCLSTYPTGFLRTHLF
jgi:superfamily I DNA and/or RNA helicase